MTGQRLSTIGPLTSQRPRDRSADLQVYRPDDERTVLRLMLNGPQGGRRDEAVVLDADQTRALVAAAGPGAWAEAQRLVAGIRELLADMRGAPCCFFACPGADHPAVGMATCNVCGQQVALKELIGEPPPPCVDLECYLCRGEDPPWCATHEEQRVTECPPECPERRAAEAAVLAAVVAALGDVSRGVLGGVDVGLAAAAGDGHQLVNGAGVEAFVDDAQHAAAGQAHHGPVGAG